MAQQGKYNFFNKMYIIHFHIHIYDIFNPSILFCVRHIFQLHIPNQPTCLSSLRIKLNFATPACINNNATVSLYILKTPYCQHSQNPTDTGTDIDWLDESSFELICGPLKIKPFLDITEQSLSLHLSHPRLLTSLNSLILLCFEQLFVDNYSKIAEEISKSMEGKKTETDSHVVRRHMGIKSRVIRRATPTTRSVYIVHSTLFVTLLPYKGSHSMRVCRSLIPLVFSKEMIFKLLLSACEYCVEQEEYSRLPESVCMSVNDYHQCKMKSMEDGNEQFRALDMISWITSVAFCDTDR